MKRWFAWIGKHERHISTLVFVGGFLLDTLTVAYVELSVINAIFSAYLVFVALLIVLTHLFSREKPDAPPSAKRPWRTLLPIAAQFFLGSLLSGCLVLYTSSASLYASWPFLALFAAVFLGNEVFQKYRERLAFQMGLFFFALYSYAIFAIPIATGYMNTWVFLLSGLVSVSVYALIILILYHVSWERLEASLRVMIVTAAGILGVVNAFYFTGILPPLPLSLKDAGIYHSIERTTDGYVVRGEPLSYNPFVTQTLHIPAGAPAYAYSAVFAPVTLTTPIVHRWQRYDDAQGWVTMSVVPFPIRGGRDSGYRGYSELTRALPGAWRVRIETQSGALLGRIRFNIATVASPPALTTDQK